MPSFEFALRERAARLANFRHAYYARVRRIDRVQQAAGLAIVSDHVEGTRLSDILRVAHEKHLQLDINAAICLIRQLVPAVAMLHENARDAAHGLIAPERIIVTPHTRLVIVEHVLAAAIEQLQFGRERLWQEFRIAMPPSAGVPRFDHRADVTGVGLVALALVLGRPIGAERVPARDSGAAQRGARALAARRRTAAVRRRCAPGSRARCRWTRGARSRRRPRRWPRSTRSSPTTRSTSSAPVALETFLSRYIAALLEPTLGDAPEPLHAPFTPAPRPFRPPAGARAAAADRARAVHRRMSPRRAAAARRRPRRTSAT